jgi:hypothetical protein
MQINVFDMIKDDKFFIGSYPDGFLRGRWFTVEELVFSSYEKIEAEYLEKYNPNGQSELELGVFDIDNFSGLWSGEYDVSSLIDKLREIQSTEYYEIDLEIYEFTEDFFEESGMSAYDVARAVYFGKINSWNDDYIGFNGNGNFVTYSETEYQDEIETYVKDLGLF